MPSHNAQLMLSRRDLSAARRETHQSRAQKWRRISIRHNLRYSAFAALVALSTVAAVNPARAQSVASFYAGKTVVLLVGSAPGGGYDAQARLLARHIGDHIPGHPSVVVENMPGAGGLAATNDFANVGPKDGSEFALVPRTALLAKIVAPSAVHFDVAKFNWLGSIMSEPGVLVAWHTAPIKSASGLFTHELIVGGSGKLDDSETTPKVLNAVIGTKLNVVGGYPSMTAVTLAMEQGEVQGVTDWSWSNAQDLKPQYLRDRLVSVLMQFDVERIPALKDVPTPLDFAKTKADKELLKVFFTPKSVSRPVALPPGAPADRVAALRTAFAETMTDPAFIADAKRSKILIDPSSYQRVDEAVDLINGAPPDVLRRLALIFSANAER